MESQSKTTGTGRTAKGNWVANWLIPAVITVLAILLTFGFFLQKELTATVKTNRLEVGDVFSVRLESRNPYEDDILFGGTIIGKNGNYIQYVDDDGDTLSTNIRDCYLFPKTATVIVTKH